MLYSVNPHTGEKIGEYPIHDSNEIEAILQYASNASSSWRLSCFEERKDIILRVGEILSSEKKELAKLMAVEMGKPISQGIQEIDKCAWLCGHYVEHCENYLQTESIQIDGQTSLVLNDPLGTILGVMPWNFPFWQCFRFFVPAILAGNVCLLKHASNVTGCAMAIESLFTKADALTGLFQIIKLPGSQTSELMNDPRVHGVSLTGSEKAGASIASAAGAAIKPSLLELGGNNAFIVLADADIEKAVDAFFTSRFLNNGQSCIASKRLLLDDAVAEVFTKELLDRIAYIQTGNPLDENVFLGPLARVDLAEELEQQVNRSLEMGAEMLIGGDREGAFYPPTVLSSISNEMPVLREETFGPVVAVVKFSGIEEAIDISNQSRFGLGVSIFTKNVEALKHHLPSFDEGAVFVNDFVKSDPRLPFGGIKVSGFGRELGKDGILAFVNRKTIVIREA